MIECSRPRGDVVVGRIDPEKGIHYDRPLLVVEVWDPASRPSVRNSRRAYWTARELQHYWQVLLTEPAIVEVYDLAQPLAPLQRAVGDQPITISEPLAVTVRPDQVAGWSLRMFQQATAEAARASVLAAANEALLAENEMLRARLAELEKP